jgi:hypothetical protein
LERASAAAANQYPLVVANLYVDALVALEPTVAATVSPGGRLITSGVLRSQQGRLRQHFAAPRWRVRSATRSGAWVTSVFERTSQRGAGQRERTRPGAHGGRHTSRERRLDSMRGRRR